MQRYGAKFVNAPLLVLSVAFAAGILCSQWIEKPQTALILSGFIFLVAILSVTCKNDKLRNIAILSAFIGAGAVRAFVFNVPRQDDWTKFERISKLKGEIVKIGQTNEGLKWADVKVLSLLAGGKKHVASGKIRIYIRGWSEIHCNDLIIISGTPRKLPRENELNFFTSSFVKTLTKNKIRGTMWIKGDALKVVGVSEFPICRVFERIRTFLRRGIKSTLPENEAALLAGIFLGDKSELPADIRSMFSNTGVIHIMAVSGLHVGIVAGMLWFLLKRLKLRNSLRALMTIAMLFMYCFLVGFKPSVVRATVMSAFILSSHIFKRRPNSFNALGAAALLILAINPNQLTNIGFQLSFTAAGGILYFYPRLANLLSEKLPKTKLGKILSLLLLTVAVQLGTAPLVAYFFHKFQLIAPVANLFVVPAVGIGLWLAFAASLFLWLIPFVGIVLFKLDSIIMSYILFVVKFFDRFRYSYVPISHPNAISILGAYILFLGLLNIPYRRWGKHASLVGTTLLAIPALTAHEPCNNIAMPLGKDMYAAYFETKDGKTALFIDCDRSDFEFTIKPLLLARGHKSIDVLIIPATRKTLKSAEEIINALHPKTIFISYAFPDEWLKPSEPQKSDFISARFVSPKNAIIEFCDKRIFILLAPMDSPVDSVDILVVDFPEELFDTGIHSFPHSTIRILGERARGCWHTISRIGRINLHNGAVWFKICNGEISIKRPWEKRFHGLLE